jgi:hypothetical protein
VAFLIRVLFLRLEDMPAYNSIVTPARRWERQLLTLRQNNGRKAGKHDQVRRDFEKLTSSPGWRNHFITLTKPRGVYEQLAKKFGLSARQVRRIIRPLLPAAKARQK